MAELGDVLCTIMEISQDLKFQCRLQPTAGSQDLFPIPAPGDGMDISQREGSLKALVGSLNSLAGQAVFAKTRGSAASIRVLKRLSKVVASSPFLSLFRF